MSEVICGLTPEELAAALPDVPAYRAKQIWKWIVSGIQSFDEMKNLPAGLREELVGRFSVNGGTVTDRLEGEDAIKLQITLADGCLVECVLLTDASGRKTACMSSQVGCPLACVFCKTGSLGFKRNLSTGEVIGQFLHLQELSTANPANELISNIVFMGMGEPLLNFEAVKKAVGILTDADCFGLSPRRITVSTAGIAGGIRRLADELPQLRLALSLTTAREGLRRELMPVTRAEPLESVKEALQYWQGRTGKRFTLEAALLGGVNTSDEDAQEMGAFVKGFAHRPLVNLIPWNPADGLRFADKALETPTQSEIAAYVQALERHGVKAELRRKKGSDVAGACGQLGSSS